jgi:class I fructose-bisphosphate aldolase
MAGLGKIMTKGRAIFLAYDQGMEHGPTDFNDRNVDPKYIMKIAKRGRFSGIIFQKGVAEKYYQGSVPLIIKLNGKTNLVKGDPLSTQVCSVKEAIKLGAKAVGYTIYIGSIHEQKMFREFGKIEEEAHAKGLPVIAWLYPRGKSVKKDTSRDVLAYAARVGLELGADIIKMKYNGNPGDLKWAVKSAGKAKVVIAGGLKKDEKKLIHDTYDIIQSGACGLAIGRNIWQSESPLKITKALKKVIFHGAKPKEAMKEL